MIFCAGAALDFLHGQAGSDWQAMWHLAYIQSAVRLRAGANREILDFLRTGVLEWKPLGPCTRVRYVAPGGPPPTDWVGLNYYSRVVMDWRCQVALPSLHALGLAAFVNGTSKCFACPGLASYSSGVGADVCLAHGRRLLPFLRLGAPLLHCTIAMLSTIIMTLSRPSLLQRPCMSALLPGLRHCLHRVHRSSPYINLGY